MALKLRDILFGTLALACLFTLNANAQTLDKQDAYRLADTSPSAPTYVIFAEDAGRDAFEIDSIFFLRSLPIVFPVGESAISQDNPELQHFINYAVPMLHRDSSFCARIRMRSASSPEGPLSLNQQLSIRRRDALLKIFEEHGVKASEMQIDVVDEEYELLAFTMRQAGDPDADVVSRMVADNINNTSKLKSLLQEYDEGRLWHRMLKEYFPQLRASRFIVILPQTHASDAVVDTLPSVGAAFDNAEHARHVDSLDPTLGIDSTAQWDGQIITATQREPRRELLAIKTNILEWGAYVPQYGFCPMPNVELEFYPRHGHWTVGASFDCPWWVGNIDNHKYFEVRNYELYTRYYLRNSNRSYKDAEHKVPAAGAAFRGLYLQAYAHAGLYQIGFSESKGWVGEGIGGGLGIGYMLPLSRDGHWRMDFNVHVGVFYTKYDPYRYGCPVENIKDGLYYYDYAGQADQFVKRQYSLTWYGPTRVGISISYDLLYKRNHRRGISLRRKEAVKR